VRAAPGDTPENNVRARKTFLSLWRPVSSKGTWSTLFDRKRKRRERNEEHKKKTHQKKNKKKNKKKKQKKTQPPPPPSWAARTSSACSGEPSKRICKRRSTFESPGTASRVTTPPNTAPIVVHPSNSAAANPGSARRIELRRRLAVPDSELADAGGQVRPSMRIEQGLSILSGDE